MCEDDLDAVLEIESSSFSRPWTRVHFLDEIQSPFGRSTVAITPEGAIAGYICVKQVLDEAEILDVAVSGSMRGRGIGRFLVESALEECRNSGGGHVSLEVRVGNEEAITLYRKIGFRETGRRKQYYDNGEDAILMQIDFWRCDAV